jgi:DNA modification methylase
MKLINIKSIQSKPNRQRQEISAEAVQELADSIVSIGLIHPVVVREDNSQYILVAGERRLKALEYVWELGDDLHYGKETIPRGMVPCNFLGTLDELTAFEIELDENIKRQDITWQERSQAVAQLEELRRLQNEKAGLPPPTIREISLEVRPDNETSDQDTRKELILARHLDDPDIKKAKSLREAYKVLQRKESNRRSAELGESIGKTFTAADHTLIKGDCLPWLANCPPNTFDVILTDPPYGMDAQDFGDSGGITAGAHFYEDTHQHWQYLMESFLPQSFRITKPQAHLYIFCDPDRFIDLRERVRAVGWKPFRTPLIWHNPGGSRAPWPEQGPQRKYQICLYATKGDRRVTQLFPDLVSFTADDNLGHPAQKPVELYRNLLVRSIRPGDSVLDPFCGTGPIFPAAHDLKVRATGIEMDAAAYGIAVSRLEGLK